MAVTFIDHPVFYPIEEYEKSINRMLDRLKQQEGLSALYQIGGISAPGISDIDLVVVFADKFKTQFNPLANLISPDNYFYVHSLFGACVSNFKTLNEFLLQVNYKLRYGKDIPIENTKNNNSDEKILKTQIAVEYLLKNLISMQRQRLTGIVRVRSLLLEINAIKYDFELLNINSGRIVELVYELVHWRNVWFSKRPSDKKINVWFLEYLKEMEVLLRSIFEMNCFYSENELPLRLMRTSKLINNSEFSLSLSGLPLGFIPFLKKQKLQRIAFRLSRINVQVPVKRPEAESIIDKRFNRMRELDGYNKSHLPFFQPLTTVMPELYK